MNKISEFFPELEVLDLENNRIFQVESIEILQKLKNICELNIRGNPICNHLQVNEMILDVIPQIEMVNNK